MYATVIRPCIECRSASRFSRRSPWRNAYRSSSKSCNESVIGSTRCSRTTRLMARSRDRSSRSAGSAECIIHKSLAFSPFDSLASRNFQRKKQQRGLGDRSSGETVNLSHGRQRGRLDSRAWLENHVRHRQIKDARSTFPDNKTFQRAHSLTRENPTRWIFNESWLSLLADHPSDRPFRFRDQDHRLSPQIAWSPLQKNSYALLCPTSACTLITYVDPSLRSLLAAINHHLYRACIIVCFSHPPRAFSVRVLPALWQIMSNSADKCVSRCHFLLVQFQHAS